MVKSLEREREREREGGRKEGEEAERQATGISFYSNHHFAHGNKLPALLKHREMGGAVVAAVVVVVVLRCGCRAEDGEENTMQAH